MTIWQLSPWSSVTSQVIILTFDLKYKLYKGITLRRLMIAVICFINGVIVLVSLKSFTDTDKTRKLLRMVDPTISSMGHEARMKRENTDLGFLLQLAATDNLREKHPCFNLSMQAMKMARLEKVNVDDRTPYLRLLKSMIKWSVKQKSDEAFSDDKVKKLIANLAHGRNY